MGRKTPKFKGSFKIGKTPKTHEIPSTGREQISWQLSHIDDESKWGVNVFTKHVEVGDENQILNDLEEGAHNDLLDALSTIKGEKYRTFDHLIDKIEIESKGNCKLSDLKAIFKNIEKNIFWTEFYNKIRHFESKNWLEIEKEGYGRKGKTKHHSVHISKLIPEAQERLEKLKLDDIEELYSIRLTGKIRIWGIRHSSVLRVLWFDRNHEICPSTYN